MWNINVSTAQIFLAGLHKTGILVLRTKTENLPYKLRANFLQFDLSAQEGPISRLKSKPPNWAHNLNLVNKCSTWNIYVSTAFI